MRRKIENIVPTLTLTSMFDEPSSGSKTTMYLAWGEPPWANSGCSFSSEAIIATLSRTRQRVHQHLVGIDVELLLHLALHVDVAGRAQDVGEARAADLGLDHLGGQRDAGEQPGKLARHAGKPPLLAQNVLLHGNDRGVDSARGSLEGRGIRLGQGCDLSNSEIATIAGESAAYAPFWCPRLSRASTAKRGAMGHCFLARGFARK